MGNNLLIRINLIGSKFVGQMYSSLILFYSYVYI